ncbi:MAG: oxidoreductase [Saprospiraceae bacterium]
MENKKKTALIAGASGLVGGHCLATLLENDNYSKVISIGRRALTITHSKLEQHIIDFNKLESYQTLFEVNHVFCCLGTTIKKAGSKEKFRLVDQVFPMKMAQLAKLTGVEVYSIVTAMGGNPKSSIFYNQVKGEVERDLETLDIPTVHVLQPSLLLGDRNERRTGEAIAQALFKVINPLFVGKLKAFKGIPGKQVAETMVRLSNDGSKGYQKHPSNLLW